MDRDSDPAAPVTPPKPGEYLPAAIQRAVVDAGLKHPATVYPVALGISSGVVGWLLNVPLLYVSALALPILGAAWAATTIFFRHQTVGGRYLRSLNLRQRAYEDHLKGRLAVGLRDCGKVEHLNARATLALDQLANIQEKFANVAELLEMKLHTGEITFGRFLGAAEQASLSVLDNLKQVMGILKSAGSIAPDTLRRRLGVLAEKPAKSAEDRVQETALADRLALWHAQMEKVDRLIAQNEAAMTEMERISAAVAEWRTDGRFSDMDLESAIARLHELAARAYAYDRSDRITGP